MNYCYTAIFGDYDQLHEPLIMSDGWEYVCFTDQNIKSDTYKIVQMQGNQLTSREIKWQPHYYLGYNHRNVWHDASIQVNCDLNKMPLNMIMKHPFNSNQLEEVETCIKLKKDDLKRLEKAKRWVLNGNCTGELFANGIQFRAGSVEYARLLDSVWFLVQKLTIRDQIVFPFALHNSEIKPEIITWYEMFNHFKYKGHKK